MKLTRPRDKKEESIAYMRRHSIACTLHFVRAPGVAETKP